MDISTIFNNFARGRLDHDINSRSDLPAYKNGADVFKNFYSNFKGNAIFRGGFENLLQFEDCAFIRFNFNRTQQYLLVLTDLEMRFLTYDVNGNFGFVESAPSTPLVVATPWSLAEAKELSIEGTAQSGDLMFMVHPSHEPRLLTRVSATSFTLATYVRVADPFTGANDYPTCVALFEGAIYYANTNNQRTTFFRSKIGDLFDMTYGTAADDAFEYDVADLTDAIVWLRAASNSLIAGSAQGLIPINGGGVNSAITPTNVTAKISDVDGSNDTAPVRKEQLLFYINSEKRNLNYFNYDIIQETFQSKDSNIGAYDITEGGIDKLVYKKDRNNLIWSIREGADLVSLNFNLDERIIGWHEHESVAEFKDIIALNDSNGKVSLMALLEYKTEFYICRLAEEQSFPLRNEFYTGEENEESDDRAYKIAIAEILKEANHLDLSTQVKNLFTSTITYTGDVAEGSTGTITDSGSNFTAGDVGNKIVYKTKTGREYAVFLITGYTAANEVTVEVETEPTDTTYDQWYRTFNLIGGFTDFIGETVDVVGDGGYLGEFVVDGSGEITLPTNKEVSVAWVGFKYEGLIKTFNLGFFVGSVETRATAKAVHRSYITFISSAGGQYGTDLYNMQDIQEYDTESLYDFPPLPMDGQSRPLLLNDNFSKEKFLYMRQEEPLPLQITGVITEVYYVAESG